eukprot:scaffold16271_cov30-Phaeocystis_antarctica.AAC.4
MPRCDPAYRSARSTSRRADRLVGGWGLGLELGLGFGLGFGLGLGLGLRLGLGLGLRLGLGLERAARRAIGRKGSSGRRVKRTGRPRAVQDRGSRGSRGRPPVVGSKQ